MDSLIRSLTFNNRLASISNDSSTEEKKQKEIIDSINCLASYLHCRHSSSVGS